MKPKLRVGLMLDGVTVPYWASQAVQRIVGSDYAEVALLIVNDRPKPHRHSLLYSLYARFDGAMNRTLRDPLTPEPLPPGLETAERVRLEPIDDGSSLTEETLGKIRKANLDILLDLRPTSAAELSRCSRYGTLTFSPGDGELYGALPGFWEIYDGTPITESQVIRTADGAASVIYHSYSGTTAGSEKRNRSQVFHKGISFLPRVLEALHRQGDDALIALGSEPFKNISPIPGNLDMLRYLMRRAPRTARFAAGKAFREERWAVRYYIGTELPTSFDDFTTITPPPHAWYGDPHVMRDGDRFHIFIEEMTLPKAKHPGHISVIEVDRHGRHTDPVKVLERPYHLSYPFVFEWGGQHYMVPESSAGRTIELYEAEEYPFRWRHVRNIMDDVLAVDSTLVRKDDRWWLFCNMVESEGASLNDELFLFSSDDLFSDRWEPHPMNPIVSDVRNARPAGRPFERDGILYRPSQDSSICYGYAVNINRVVELNERRYAEERVSRIGPDSFPNATRVHTFSHVPGMTVVDTYMAWSRFAPHGRPLHFQIPSAR